MSDESKRRSIAWTPEDRARHRAVRERFQRDKPTPEQVRAGGEYVGPVPLETYLDFKDAVRELRRSREAGGLSLDEVAVRSGIASAVLGRLEAGTELDAPIAVFVRYAAAVGKRVGVTLQDVPPPGPPESAVGV